MRYLLLISFWALAPYTAGAQAIGLYGLDKDGGRGSSLHYQNDAFGNTDYYYSQGVQIAASIPAIKNTFLSRLFFRSEDARYGIAVEHDAYTPTSILSDSILYGDRPYAASALAQLYSVASSPTQRTRVSSMLSVGIIGPAAGGEEIQAGIHRNTNNDLPHGWQFQIQNDLILNYAFIYQRNFVAFADFFYADGLAGADAGTYNTRGFLGINLSAGLLNDPFVLVKQQTFRLFLEDQGIVQVVGYNATLQGGLFNDDTPYVITASSIRRIVFKNTVALNIGFKKLTLNGNYTWLGKEFETGKSHAWGGIQVSYRF